jgi:hypothetical protein
LEADTGAISAGIGNPLKLVVADAEEVAVADDAGSPVTGTSAVQPAATVTIARRPSRSAPRTISRPLGLMIMEIIVALSARGECLMTFPHAVPRLSAGP